MNALNKHNSLQRIILFSILVNAVAFLSPLLGGSPSEPGFGFILWGVAPMLVALVMRAATRDWADLGLKPAFKKNVLWYGISFFAIPVLMVLTLWTGVLTAISTVSGFSLGEFLNTVLIALPIFFIFAIFEEVGWRGYLTPKLDALGVNRFVSSVIVGIVWATWHLPYITELTWAYSSGDLAVFLPRFYLICIMLSILYGEIRSGAGTFWTAVLMHAVSNSFGHPLAAEYVSYAAGAEFFANLGNGVIFIVFVGLVGIAIHRWRLKKALS